ncbi:MAG: M56 family metallopeptidase [Gemmatimonadaceae bacterium]
MSILTSLALSIGGTDVAALAESVYTAALLASLLVAVAVMASSMLRRAGASAEARSLLWRSTVVSMLAVFIGRQHPLHWIAVVVPSALAAPIVALGRARMIISGAPIPGAAVSGDLTASATSAIAAVRALVVVYLAGVVVVLVPTIVFSIRARRRLTSARLVTDDRWMSILEGTRGTLGVARRVRLYVDDAATVPMTWGVLRPIVVLPTVALDWCESQLRIVLLHELGHVRAGDWTFRVLSRVVCALYWFHPASWWVARNLRDDCELSCDDRVIAAGVRRSDYAELLVTAAEVLRGAPAVEALALSERGGLRARLAAILDVGHVSRPLRREWAAAAVAATLALVCPASAVQLAPTRDVLTTLMRDARWESRAYAVMGLAQRADSIAEARSAAEADPSPRVRAWARFALGESTPSSAARAIIREH